MNQTENKQLGALGFCALSVPSILFLPQYGWAAILPVTLGSALILCFGKPLLKEGRGWFFKLMCVLLHLWNIGIMGKLASTLSEVNGVQNPLPGLLLLLLAGYAVKKQVLPKVAAILAFFLGAIYGILYLFALPNVEIEALKPQEPEKLLGLPYGFLPILLLYMYKDEEKKTRSIWAGAGLLLALGAAIVTQGMGAPDFYTASKSVNLLGTMERLEPFVAAAVTAGGFCILGLLLRVNINIFNNIGKKENNLSVEVQLTIAALVCILTSAKWEWLWSLGTTVCWGLIPIMTQLMVFRKKV